MTIDLKALICSESGILIILGQVFFFFSMRTILVSVSVFYKHVKPDTSAEDDLHHVQSVERGITRVQKNAAQTDSERKEVSHCCP